MRLFWRMPGEIDFGPGRVAVVGRRLAGAGVRRVLVVTDAGVRAAGLLERVTEPLAEAGLAYHVFDGVVPNPTTDNVEQALGRFHEVGAEAVVALGGGSVLDVGKMVAAVARNPGEVEAFAGWQKFRAAPAPMLAIPTTAGTGSEVSQYAVITSRRQQRKLVYGGPSLLARWAVVDPELTHSLPPALTAATGMDALTHALEALVSRGTSPLAQSLALDAIQRVVRFLPVAFRSGTSAEARAEMAYAQLLAGMAFSNAGLGAVHALAHQLGAAFDIAHGVANAVLLPHVLAFNQAISGDAYAQAADRLGLAPASEALIDRVRALLVELALPTRLRDLDVPRSALARLAEMALDDMSLPGNPRQATSADLLRILEAAY